MSPLDTAGAVVAAAGFAGMAGLAVFRILHQGFLHTATVHLVCVAAGCVVMAGGAVGAIAGAPLAWAAVGVGMLGCTVPTGLTIRAIAAQPLEDDHAVLRQRLAEMSARCVVAMRERDAALAALEAAEDDLERVRGERDLALMRGALSQVQAIRDSQPPHLRIAHAHAG